MINKFDIGIIWKKIHKQTSELEDKELTSWMKNNPERQEYFQRTASFLETGPKIKTQDINVAAAKKKVSFRIFILPKLKIAFRVAAVFVGISILAILYNNINTNIKSEKIVEAIAPGNSKAILILSDGSRHNLEQTSTKRLKEEGAQIVNSGKELNYETLSSTNRKKLTTRYNTLNIPRGGEFFLSLSDGTKVWLNAETVLSYPLQFGQKERKVELVGEAYFEVTPNKDRPFKVETNGQVIEVLGTSFNVNAYADKSIIYTTLVEGAVKINVDDFDQDILLEPGFQCQLSKSDKELVVSKVNVRQYIAWKDGSYIFENEALEGMMVMLSRWYDFTYSFEKDKLRQLRFTGNLKRNEKFEDILTIIENTNEVKFKVEEKQVFIY